MGSTQAPVSCIWDSGLQEPKPEVPAVMMVASPEDSIPCKLRRLHGAKEGEGGGGLNIGAKNNYLHYFFWGGGGLAKIIV